MPWAVCLAVLALMTAVTSPARADEPSLTLTLGDASRQASRSELLARPDAADVAIPDDIDYRRSSVYRAVPLLPLLGPLAQDRFDTLELRALDGFVAQVPLALVREGAAGGAVAWIAVEPADHPWPNLPGKDVGAGPFYLIWQYPERSGVSREQWPYQLASVAAVERPEHRWPQLASDPSLPQDAAARRGQDIFIANCLPCHRLNGGGVGEVGPDLGTPMNAVDYLTDQGLRALVRDPKAVRTWPSQQMPGFGADALPEASLAAVVAYLRHIAGRDGLQQRVRR